VIRLDESDDEAGHHASGSYGSIRNRLRSSQKIVERFAAVGFAVDEAALIESPALI
jgi:hypothetical protein